MIGSVTEEKVRVRYAETDQMGHAYYANYLIWFEQARSAFFRERGLPYKEIEERGYKFPVVEAHARYKGEVKYDDEITIRVWVGELKRAAVRIDYEVVLGGKVVTEGYTWHVCVGSDFKAVTLPLFLRELVEPTESRLE
ncbi:MAG: acyl-CoA thioesterase [Chthonomonas sp.]|nr:acyl-CoA thioesterase [Chthonomonas sp.]